LDGGKARGMGGQNIQAGGSGKGVYRSGFVSIIGRPNVGKSTFLNQVVGEKAAIVSDKPQTTRNQIRAILTDEEYQIIFIDTPGVHKPRHRLGNYMVGAAHSTLNDVEVVLFFVEADHPPGRGDVFISRWLKGIDTPVFLVLNKIDRVSQARGEEHLALYRQLHAFGGEYMISALHGENIGTLLKDIIACMPEGPRYYPPDMVTDKPEYFLVSELIREKVLQLTREEVPFAVAVEIEEMKERENRELIDIRAVIHVDRKSQKGIVIGKGGSMLREIGTEARPEIEALLGQQVYMDLWVKVSPGWRDREAALRNLGYRSD
jgi:GTP-binding protein Era